MLSNLLQELALAQDHGQKSIVLDEARLKENPVSRLSRMVRPYRPPHRNSPSLFAVSLKVRTRSDYLSSVR